MHFLKTGNVLLVVHIKQFGNPCSRLKDKIKMKVIRITNCVGFVEID